MLVQPIKIEFARKFNKWFLLSMKTFNVSPLICSKCKTKENIPTEVVEMLDEADSFGVDLSEPPKFNCKKRSGKMVPIYYISVHGRTYEYKDI